MPTNKTKRVKESVSKPKVKRVKGFKAWMYEWFDGTWQITTKNIKPPEVKAMQLTKTRVLVTPLPTKSPNNK